jgi:DNA-binding transcriptional regulator YdaS (Cro superfamily)
MRYPFVGSSKDLAEVVSVTPEGLKQAIEGRQALAKVHTLFVQSGWRGESRS